MSPNKRKEEIYKQVVSITKLSSNFVCFVSKQVQFNNNHTKTQIVSFFAVLIHLQNKGSLNVYNNPKVMNSFNMDCYF